MSGVPLNVAEAGQPPKQSISDHGLKLQWPPKKSHSAGAEMWILGDLLGYSSPGPLRSPGPLLA